MLKWSSLWSILGDFISHLRNVFLKINVPVQYQAYRHAYVHTALTVGPNFDTWYWTITTWLNTYFTCRLRWLYPSIALSSPEVSSNGYRASPTTLTERAKPAIVSSYNLDLWSHVRLRVSSFHETRNLLGFRVTGCVQQAWCIDPAFVGLWRLTVSQHFGSIVQLNVLSCIPPLINTVHSSYGLFRTLPSCLSVLSVFYLRLQVSLISYADCQLGEHHFPTVIQACSSMLTTSSNPRRGLAFYNGRL